MRENLSSSTGFVIGTIINVAPDRLTSVHRSEALPDALVYNSSHEAVICRLTHVCIYSSISGTICVHPSALIAAFPDTAL